MIGMTLLTFPPLVEGTLIKRYKRFLADIQLDNGKIVTVHCANTGPMTGVLTLGGRVRIRYIESSSRKLKWSWEQAQVENSQGRSCWVGVNTSLPNKIVKIAIEKGLLRKELGAINEIKKEVKYGKDGRSRIDLYLYPDQGNPDQRNIYVEIKNTTWTESESALFPDTVTKRGQKHLKEMIDVLSHSRAVLIPCISREDAKSFAPGDSADREYGELFRTALSKGVEVVPCSFGFFEDKITWQGTRPFRENQN